MTGWLRPQTGPRDSIGLTTNLDLDEEVFASLEYLSEIPSVGINYLKSLNIDRPKLRFPRFQAFIRQGKTFYQTASKLHFRAAALMYYYSFLNLVKAYISLYDPRFVVGAVGHGLTLGRFSPRPFTYQAVYTDNRGGVFQRFYELQNPGITLGRLKLNIPLLLGYSQDVAYEYERAGFGSHRILRTKVRMFSHQASRISWPIIAIQNFNVLRGYKKTLAGFYKYFEEVNLDQRVIHEVFDLVAAASRSFSFFQSITTYDWMPTSGLDTASFNRMREEIQAAVKDFYDPPIFNDEHDFHLALPLHVNNQIPMNQATAIYSLMFYIGSLVRYRPDYLEKLLNSKDAWIIERFVRGAPITFLLTIGNLILGKNYMYDRR
jgi:hypothetical protein